MLFCKSEMTTTYFYTLLTALFAMGCSQSDETAFEDSDSRTVPEDTGGSDGDSDADGDTDTDVDGDTDSDADGDMDADTDSDSDTDGDTDTDMDADTDGDTDMDTDTDTDGDMDADTDTDSDSDADSDGDTDSDTDSDGDTNTVTDSDGDMDADTVSDTDSDTDTRTDLEENVDTDSSFEEDTDSLSDSDTPSDINSDDETDSDTDSRTDADTDSSTDVAICDPLHGPVSPVQTEDITYTQWEYDGCFEDACLCDQSAEARLERLLRCEPFALGYWWALGSELLRPLAIESGSCVLEIASEMEGWINVHQCTLALPLSPWAGLVHDRTGDPVGDILIQGIEDQCVLLGGCSLHGILGEPCESSPLNPPLCVSGWQLPCDP